MSLGCDAAGLTDLPALVRLDGDAFGADGWSERVWRDTLAAAHRQVLVVRDPVGVAGYAVMAVAGDAGELERIAVRPDRRGAGVGDALMRATVAGWRRAGVVHALLEVRADNEPAAGLYARHGWRQIARRAGYYDLGRTDALVLRLDLPVADVTAPDLASTEVPR